MLCSLFSYLYNKTCLLSSYDIWKNLQVFLLLLSLLSGTAANGQNKTNTGK